MHDRFCIPFLVLCLGLPALVSGGEVQMSCELAEAARQRLGTRVRQYFPHWIAFAEETVGTVRVVPAGDQCTLEVNGSVLDLAYTYVAGKNSSWLNLALELGLAAGDMPRTLPITVPSRADLDELAGFYTGTIGELPIMLELARREHMLDGFYCYERIGSPLHLEIERVAEGRIWASEEGEHGRTGAWDLVSVTNGAKYRGEWRNPAGNRTLAVKLERYAERVTVEQQVPGGVVYLTYPRFLDPQLRKINQELDSDADTTVPDFLREAAGVYEEYPDMLEWDLDCSIEVSLYKAGLISLVGHSSEYSGGAHGNSGYWTNVYLVEGHEPRPLELGDLFGPDQDALNRISELVIADLARQQATDVVSGEIESLSPGELASFALAPNHLFFYFSPYAVAPYAAGPFIVKIPYAEILELVNPESPLRRLLFAAQASKTDAHEQACVGGAVGNPVSGE